MLKISGLRLARGATVLIDQADLTLFPGERLALIGANGAGKSTLLAAIRGELAPQSGDISLPPGWRISHVAQETPALPDSALDFVLQGDEPLQRIENELKQLEGGSSEAADRLGELYALKQDIDGYAAPARVSALLHGLGFSNDDLKRAVADFSGGWRMRLNLARALASRSELILLDEPTNHLDIESIEGLLDGLSLFKGTVVFVSHDRHFVGKLATRVVELRTTEVVDFSGSYDEFLERYGDDNTRR